MDMDLEVDKYAHRALLCCLAVACAAAPSRAAAFGDPLWKFFTDYAVTVVEPVPGVSGTGMDLLVGSEDDSLYLVKTRGAAAGKQAWASAFKATLSAATALADINGDGAADAAAGDEFGVIEAVSGADGKPIWAFLTFGTVLSLAALPDVNGDGVGDVAAGSENDTVYCLSGKPGGKLGKSIWEFALPVAKHGPPGGTAAPKAAARPSMQKLAVGVNSVAVVGEKGKAPFGLAAGTSLDTVYCLALADGAVKWKTGLPGDIWKVVAFPDQDDDGVEELLLACGADAAYLLNGATGAVIWSHAVTAGATAVAAAPDMDGDGKPDALIGDGDGAVHCVPGNSKGSSVKSAWMYSFKDTSTILSIAVPGDLDKDGRAECVVGTSNDTVALLSGKGARLAAASVGGMVNALAVPGDISGDGAPDWVAGSEIGYAQAFSGSDVVSLRPVRPPAAARAARMAGRPSPLFPRPGSGSAYDGRGRAYPVSHPISPARSGERVPPAQAGITAE
jgi:hypothetical protein